MMTMCKHCFGTGQVPEKRYQVATVTGYRGNYTIMGYTPDKETALIAARVLALRFHAAYVSSNLHPVACYGDAIGRRDRREFSYEPEKAALLSGQI